MIRFNIRSRRKPDHTPVSTHKKSIDIPRDFLMFRSREKHSPTSPKKFSTSYTPSTATPSDSTKDDLTIRQVSFNSQLNTTSQSQPASLNSLPAACTVRRKSLPITSLNTFNNSYSLCTTYNNLTTDLSYVVSNDTLPKRMSSGYALDYYSYTPSSHNSAINTKTRRRGRVNSKDKSQKCTFEKPSNSTVDIGLDFDSLARRKKLGGNDLDFIPLEKRIHSKIVQLRRLLTEAERLGDFEVLKNLVSIHESKISRTKKKIDHTKLRVREASIFAKNSANSVNGNTTSIRRTCGKPDFARSRRTVSILKASTTSLHANERAPNCSVNRETILGQRQEVFTHTQTRVKPDVSKVSRKSSRLRRLGSAGSMLMRRLSRGSSQADENSVGLRVDPSAPVILDEETVARLKSSPDEVLRELESELHQLLSQEHADAIKLKQAQSQLAEKRQIHGGIMDLLDLFYGNTPGWEENPISQAMFPETADMTEAGLESERDLVEIRLLLNRAQAAFGDYVLGANAMLVVTDQLCCFVQKLQDLIVSVDESEPIFLMDGTIESKNEDLHREFLKELDTRMTKTYAKCRKAAECCVGAPRILVLKTNVQRMKAIFDSELRSMEDQDGIFQCDLQTILNSSKSILAESRIAEMFVMERRNLIGEDVVKIEAQVDRCEEYVILERLGILDLHHPPDEFQ